MERKNYIDLPFKSIIEKYDYYFEGKIDFVLYDRQKYSLRLCKMALLKNDRIATIEEFKSEIIIWDIKTKKKYLELVGHKGEIRTIKVLKDNRIVSLGTDGLIKIWNSDTGQCEHTLQGNKFINPLIISEDNRIISSDCVNTIKIWNTYTQKCELVILNYNNKITSILNIGNKLILDFNYQEVKIYDITSGKHLHTLTNISSTETTRKFDNNTIMRGLNDRNLIIWNITTGESTILIKNIKRQMSSYLILPNENMITCDYSIKIWKKDELQFTLLGHTGIVTILNMLPDGRLMSISVDLTIKVWNLDTQKCELTFKNDSRITYMENLSDGRIVTRDDSRIIVWK